MSAEQQAQTHPEPGRDTPERGGDFVVPAPDGVESGVPFHHQEHSEHQTPPRLPQVPGARGTERAVRGGMSLKRKLNLALGLLTLVILLLGLVSVRTLNGITASGIPELQLHAEVARVSETIKTDVYRMILAQQDYLLLEDEAARDQVTRLSGRAREDIRALAALGERIEHTEGADIGTLSADLEEALDTFDARFASQVSSLLALRESLAAGERAMRETERALAGDLDAAIAAASELAATAWPDASDGDPARIALARALERLTRDLLADRAALEAYFGSHAGAAADTLRAAAAEHLVRLDTLRSDAAAAALGEDLAGVRRALVAYAAQFKDTAARLVEEHGSEDALNQAIAGKRAAIGEASARIVSLTDELTGGAWTDIEHEGEHLQETGTGALWLVAIAAAIGLAVGLAVLLTVPRPIVAAIESLMAGAHQVARGNLTYAVDVASRDELGALADSFNQMRENLLALVQRIQRASVQLSSSINEIQAAATEQAASASEQASAVNELSASLNEMSQSAATLVSSSETVGRNVTEIAGVVTDGNHKSSQMMTSMDAIGLSTRQTAERIKALNDKMDDINEAVATISMVADQTTLLSLNASIEANKAGEMGKGFSVVAQEIRRLSDRSIDSAGNISGMVRDIQRATESSALAMDKSSEEIHHGVALVGETSQALDAINAAMERIQEQMGMILESVRAQAESARMVQTTATEMLSSANMVAKAASQTRSVTYELNAMATQLSSAVSVFRA